MPVLASKKIQLNVKVGQELLPDYLRSHYIAIYKKATEEYLKKNWRDFNHKRLGLFKVGEHSDINGGTFLSTKDLPLLNIEHHFI